MQRDPPANASDRGAGEPQHLGDGIEARIEIVGETRIAARDRSGRRVQIGDAPSAGRYVNERGNERARRGRLRRRIAQHLRDDQTEASMEHFAQPRVHTPLQLPRRHKSASR